MSESAETTRKRQPHFYGFVWLGDGRYAILQVFLECDLEMRTGLWHFLDFSNPLTKDFVLYSRRLLSTPQGCYSYE